MAWLLQTLVFSAWATGLFLQNSKVGAIPQLHETETGGASPLLPRTGMPLDHLMKPGDSALGNFLLILTRIGEGAFTMWSKLLSPLQMQPDILDLGTALSYPSHHLLSPRGKALRICRICHQERRDSGSSPQSLA